MDALDAKRLLADWRADRPVDPHDIATALALLVHLIDQQDRAQAKLRALRRPVGDMRTAAVQANEWLARNAVPDKFPGHGG